MELGAADHQLFSQDNSCQSSAYMGVLTINVLERYMPNSSNDTFYK
jgi:hypothetical protein